MLKANSGSVLAAPDHFFFNAINSVLMLSARSKTSVAAPSL
jgi:hypothetical protein